jgi:O-antigen ligase
VVAASFGWPEGKSAHSVWMETAAETGVPGVLALMLFFGVAAVRLWPVARARGNDMPLDKRMLAAGVITSIVGFAVSGQFVSVTGLEAPYYIVMIGVAMLRTPSLQAVQIVAPRIEVPAFGPDRPAVVQMGRSRLPLASRAGRQRARF